MDKQHADIDSIHWDWQSDPLLHRYAHHAMATTYEIYIRHEKADYAEGAAHEAFKELDRLEEELSRFITNSDISRINNLKALESVRVGLPAFECIQESQRIYRETDGAFDITIGPLYQCWLDKEKHLKNPSRTELNQARYRTGMTLVKLDEQEHTVRVLRDRLHLDLGGVGKGYAVDQIATLLKEWEIDTALIHGGRSSVLALEAPEGVAGWPITLSTGGRRTGTLAKVSLCNQALSGSGLQKGQHILDPRKGEPVQGKAGAWSIAPSAATTDALSTAFMIMQPEEVEAYCRRRTETRALLVLDRGDQLQKDENVLFFGPWQQADILI